MRDVVIAEAVRSPIGRRNGGLSTMHAVDLLATVQEELIRRSGIDPTEVEQVIGGCVTQVGMQAGNVTRSAWLTAGLPLEAPATTIDAQCGSSQQATNLVTSLVASGVVDVAVGCGIEIMSRLPLGSNFSRELSFPHSRTKDFPYERTSQFEGAERIADKWGISRADTDAFGLLSQQRAQRAWAEGRFDTQVVGIDAPDLDEEGKPTGSTHRVERDEGLRETNLEALAKLKPVARPEGCHTAGSSSQISDGAGAVLVMTAEKAEQLGIQPLARVVDSCLVGSDPTLMLTGPIPATERLLARNNMTIDQIDIVEINEAFASVVLAWQKEFAIDTERVNPNGGAIALGHPVGGTGAILLTKAVHELQRTGADHALVTMCCGGGLGTGTILQRL
jgi:acetyl-CoA C-acetyltransferase